MTTARSNMNVRTDSLFKVRSAAGRSAAGAKPAPSRPPLLSPEVERDLIVRWQSQGDRAALDHLVASYQGLVARIAAPYRNGGVAFADLISEGNVGLIHAIEKFDVNRGFRLSTYAVWWIRALVSELAVTSASLIKGATSDRHRRILFNLPKLKARMGMAGTTELSPEATAFIARELGVEEEDVTHVHGWSKTRELSVNVGIHGEEDSRTDWQDTLVDPTADPEARVMEADERSKRRALVRQAMDSLDARERHILSRRHFSEEPETFVDLSRHFGVTRERVRQLEARALKKLRRRVLELAETGMFADSDANDRL